MHNIVPRYLPSLGGVEVFAVRVCALAGAASRESGIASRFALGKKSVDDYVAWSLPGMMLTVRQRQHAVRV
jgi:hypothetical protein